MADKGAVTSVELDVASTFLTPITISEIPREGNTWPGIEQVKVRLESGKEMTMGYRITDNNFGAMDLATNDFNTLLAAGEAGTDYYVRFNMADGTTRTFSKVSVHVVPQNVAGFGELTPARISISGEAVSLSDLYAYA